jgi:Amt family ammonium transporter
MNGTVAVDAARNGGDTAWVLASTALVMLMTPGLALFYGGLVRRKNVLNMLMMSFICLGIVTVLWAVLGYGMSFGPDIGGLRGPGLLGRPDWLLKGAMDHLVGSPGYKIPELAFAMFQLMFAVLTVALISGSVAERVRFGGWAVFVALWVLLVYFPVAHWVFDASYPGDSLTAASHGGWLHNSPIKALDFAGGTTVHINAGAAGLALAIVVKQRYGWKPGTAPEPHNMPFVLLGASLLWFGWYGFNAGSALSAGKSAALAFTNTTLATAAAVLGWVVVEWLEFSGGKLRFNGAGRPKVLAAASGAIAGLVAITPACAFVAPGGALAIGLIAGVGCAVFVSTGWREWISSRRGGPVDDALDVVGIHLVGGLIGTLLIGFLATKNATDGTQYAGADGLFYGGGFDQLWRQAVAAITVLVFSFVMTLGIGAFVAKFVGLRVDEDVLRQQAGLDLTEHGETAYQFE